MRFNNILCFLGTLMRSDDNCIGSAYGPRVNGHVFDSCNKPELSVQKTS